MVPLLPLRSWRRLGQVPLAWTRSLPRPPQLHHLFQAVEALHHCNPLFKKKAGSADPSCGSPGVAGVGVVGEAGCCEGYRTCRGLSRRCRCQSRSPCEIVGAGSRFSVGVRDNPRAGERPWIFRRAHRAATRIDYEVDKRRVAALGADGPAEIRPVELVRLHRQGRVVSAASRTIASRRKNNDLERTLNSVAGGGPAGETVSLSDTEEGGEWWLSMSGARSQESRSQWP